MDDLDKRYQDTLGYLAGLTRFGMNLGLARIRELMARLGNPERSLRVIHIGGTNGKGSTSAMIARILQEAGYKTGLFISPHLHDYRERMTINGQMITKEAVISLVDTLRPHLEDLVTAGVEHPTEFEVHTALAFLYFKEEKVDFAVVEVGLGGEIDSTNVVHSLIAVITNVGMDHMDCLGTELVAIARVKAGIIKPGSVLVTAVDKTEALEVLDQRAKELGVKLWRAGKDVQWVSRWSSETEQEFDLFGLQLVYPRLRLRLVGAHQVRNGAMAVMVAELLGSEYGVRVSRDAIYRALATVQWPGRLELISENPKILLDGAHNVDGALGLASSLDLFKYQRLILCLGMLADKEREKVLALLCPLADEVIITKPDSVRAGDWQGMAQYAERFGKPVTCIEKVGDAVAWGMSKLGPEDMLCITGSLYMLADAREVLLANQK